MSEIFGIDSTVIAGFIAAILAATTTFLNKVRSEQGKEIIQHIEDKNFREQVIQDLVGFITGAIQANADGKTTQEEFDQLMEQGKALAIKYTDQFGLDIAPIFAAIGAFKTKAISAALTSSAGSATTPPAKTS